jgi:2-phospho-L-lactate guanylyltransferase
MRIFVPFDARNPKTRLASLLDAEERHEFARAMLEDVLAAVGEAGHEPVVLATEPIDVDVPVTVDDRPLTEAVDDALSRADRPVAVVMADLPLVRGSTVDRLFESAGDVVLAPGLGGGTNAILLRTGGFGVDFHGASIRDHRAAARQAGVEPATLDSFRLALDVDEPADLAEVLLHGEGQATDWLRAAGITLAVDDGRVQPTRADTDAAQGDENGTEQG